MYAMIQTGGTDYCQMSYSLLSQLQSKIGVSNTWISKSCHFHSYQAKYGRLLQICMLSSDKFANPVDAVKKVLAQFQPMRGVCPNEVVGVATAQYHLVAEPLRLLIKGLNCHDSAECLPRVDILDDLNPASELMKLVQWNRHNSTHMMDTAGLRIQSGAMAK